jgi:hypothetical protein
MIFVSIFTLRLKKSLFFIVKEYDLFTKKIVRDSEAKYKAFNQNNSTVFYFSLTILLNLVEFVKDKVNVVDVVLIKGFLFRKPKFHTMDVIYENR